MDDLDAGGEMIQARGGSEEIESEESESSSDTVVDLTSDELSEDTQLARELEAIKRSFVKDCTRLLLEKFVEAGFSDEEELADEILGNVCSEFKALKDHCLSSNSDE